jgi:hypothetical protein
MQLTTDKIIENRDEWEIEYINIQIQEYEEQQRDLFY